MHDKLLISASLQGLIDELSDPEEWSFRFADVDQGAHVAYSRNSSSLLAAYPTLRPAHSIAQSLLQLGLEVCSSRNFAMQRRGLDAQMLTTSR